MKWLMIFLWLGQPMASGPYDSAEDCKAHAELQQPEIRATCIRADNPRIKA